MPRDHFKSNSSSGSWIAFVCHNLDNSPIIQASNGNSIFETQVGSDRCPIWLLPKRFRKLLGTSTPWWRGEPRWNFVWNHGNSKSCKVWNNLKHFNLCDWQVMFCDVHLWCTRLNFDDSWPRRCSSCLGCNLFSLLLKLTQTIKIGLDWHFRVFFGCLHVLIHQVPSHHFLGSLCNSLISFLRSYQHAKCINILFITTVDARQLGICIHYTIDHYRLCTADTSSPFDRTNAQTFGRIECLIWIHMVW